MHRCSVRWTRTATGPSSGHMNRLGGTRFWPRSSWRRRPSPWRRLEHWRRPRRQPWRMPRQSASEPTWIGFTGKWRATRTASRRRLSSDSTALLAVPYARTDNGLVRCAEKATSTMHACVVLAWGTSSSTRVARPATGCCQRRLTAMSDAPPAARRQAEVSGAQRQAASPPWVDVAVSRVTTSRRSRAWERTVPEDW
jgi:hypothetical protein